MDLSFSALLVLMRFTVQQPRAAVKYILALRLADDARWLLFGLVVVAAALLSQIGFALLPPDAQAFWAEAMSSPVQSTVLQGAFWLLTTVGIFAMGRWGNRRGSFADALLLIGWLQVILFCLQLVQILALLILPLVAELLSVVGLALLFWLLTQFTSELHDFHAPWRVFFGSVGVLLSAALVVSVVLVIVFGTGR